MVETIRFGVSLDAELLQDFDQLCISQGYENRSEALRDLMREALERHVLEHGDAEAVGVLTLAYDHHKSGLVQKLTEAQHHAPINVVTTLHVHLDHDTCLEVLIMRGQGNLIREFAQKLRAIKGVAHGKLNLTEMP